LVPGAHYPATWRLHTTNIATEQPNDHEPKLKVVLEIICFLVISVENLRYIGYGEYMDYVYQRRSMIPFKAFQIFTV